MAEALPPLELQAALERGKALDLDTVVTELLEETEAMAEKSQLAHKLPEIEELLTGVEETAVADQSTLAEEEVIEQILTEVDGGRDAPREKLRGEALLSHLLAISRRMATIRSASPLLSYAMNEVIALVGAERGYIVLITDDGTLDFRVRRLADGSNIHSDADMISQSILNEVVRTQQSLVVHNAQLDRRFAAAHSVMSMQLRSIMCAPLRTQDRIIGAVYVESRSRSGRFTEPDLAPLEFFSNQAAVAIENANLNENLEGLVADRTWQLVEAKKAAEKANEAKTSFLSNMSHELRTPLNAIMNFSGFVYDGFYGDVNEDQQEALQQVMDSSEHLLSLINDVLDLNKIEAGMVQIIFEAVDLNQVMRHAISTATGLVKGRAIELVTNIEKDLPVIQADRRRLRQILLNLLSNAAKYTEKGEIKLTAHASDSYVEFAVADTGIGIAPADYELIFQSYGQAQHNLDNVVSTGLGLPIARQLVVLHSGNLWFESKLNVGSTFFVRLPINQETND
ncbi:MAG: GAF domain-containing protein [Chloroflexi bacterium]|nr:GAF domain-containing protein [Chloroflexota bacterium]